jgi:hypothetical protein
MNESWTNYGEVYTRRWVVDTLLDLIGYSPAADLGAKLIVEPSVGSGIFLEGIVERLFASAQIHNRDLTALGSAIRAFDLLPESVQKTRDRISKKLLRYGLLERETRSLVSEWINVADFLLEKDMSPCDFIVGNPPYIRLEDIPEEIAGEYRATWKTMRGRADIYVGFYERGLTLLKPDGVLGYICADRWMRNQYGEGLRGLVFDRFSMDQVWTLHDVDAFENQVSAYPAVTVISRKKQGPVVVASTTSEFTSESALRLTEWSLGSQIEEFWGTGVSAYRMASWFETSEMWPTGTPSLVALMEYLNENFAPLSQTVKVGIGIATGADKTYIVKDAPIERDRLLPVAMVGDLRTDGRFVWGGYHLVNPWTDSGTLVALADYPLLAAYLSSNAKLVERHTAKRNPNQWYRTIDKVNTSLTSTPKLLIQDMRSQINPVLDSGGFYPHHNIYFMTSDVWDLEVLGGILISRIGQGFIEAYGVRMRGGTLRFQSQYLRKIRLPNPHSIASDTENLLRSAFRDRDVISATMASAEAYGIDPQDYGLVDEDLGLGYERRR